MKKKRNLKKKEGVKEKEVGNRDGRNYHENHPKGDRFKFWC